MQHNVFITARERGKIVYQWAGHNTWLLHGRSYLRQMISYSSFDPDVPIIPTSRIKHMGFGIGGKNQNLVGIPGAVATAYPAGSDPNATVGNAYNHNYPILPPISTLERPVRLSGGSNPYGSAAPTDVWLTPPDPPKFLVTFPSATIASYLFFISGSAGDISYGSFTLVPISEAILVVSGDANVHTPFNQAITYVNFPPVEITSTIEVEFEWLVGL
jgi:hypothetical protein